MADAKAGRWGNYDRWLIYLVIGGIVFGLTLTSIEQFMIRRRASQWEAALRAKVQEAQNLDELTAWLDGRGAGYRTFAQGPYAVQIEYLLWTGLTGTKPHFATTQLYRNERPDVIESRIHTGSPQVLPGPQPLQWFNRIAETAPCMVWGGLFIWIIVLSERRSLRLNRACCPQCGYPIGISDVCTECGESLQSERLPGVARQVQQRLRRIASNREK